MFKEIRWLFFDVGSTIMNEQTAYEHRIRDIAAAANTAYETVYERALAYYKMNKKVIWKQPENSACHSVK